MSSDPNDELARFRMKRTRDRHAGGQGAADRAGGSMEQREAIERAREAWALRRLDRAKPPEGSPPDGD